ncbi:MAG: response regulator [Myxococcota bacterium]|nr:response regulator [Myxococcota bacterium]
MAGGPILVLDDDVEIVRLITRVLEHDRRRVVAFTDAREALEAARREAPALVFADLMMPRMDGEAFGLALRADLQEATPPLVFVTASLARREVAERCGAVATVEKPFEVQDILDLAARFIG